MPETSDWYDNGAGYGVHVGLTVSERAVFFGSYRCENVRVYEKLRDYLVLYGEGIDDRNKLHSVLFKARYGLGEPNGSGFYGEMGIGADTFSSDSPVVQPPDWASTGVAAFGYNIFVGPLISAYVVASGKFIVSRPRYTYLWGPRLGIEYRF